MKSKSNIIKEKTQNHFRGRIYLLIVVGVLSFHYCFAAKNERTQIIVGSKTFTESVILGELVTQLAKSDFVEVTHKNQLGGTRILWSALLRGEIDVYADYTGTIIQEILYGENIRNENDLKNILKEKYNVIMSKPLGFNNTYALGMKKEAAEKFNINAISDLKNHPGLVLAFTNEFMDRKDGWQGLKNIYNLPHKNVRGLDHDLAYRGIKSGYIDVTDLYSTDAEIKFYNLKVLKDDQKYFPQYKAVLLYKSELKTKASNSLNNILRLEGAIPESSMVNMNADVKINLITEANVAANFLQKKFSIASEVEEETFWGRLINNTTDHIGLVFISLSAAIVFSIPLGIIAFRFKKIGNIILSFTGIIQTIPSLALLVFMIPFFGIGEIPAIVALFFYSLLPIVRNTHLGLQDIPVQLRESAEVLGLTPSIILYNIDLPLAANSIITGIKTSAVINVGTATLGALIGAGGYGQPILTGIRLDNIPLILEGAVPAAMLAITVQFLFDLVEKIFVPRGLRLK